MSEVKPQNKTQTPANGGTQAQKGQGQNKVVFSFLYEKRSSDYVTKYIVTLFDETNEKKVLKVDVDNHTSNDYVLEKYAKATIAAAKMAINVGFEDPSAYDVLLKQSLRLAAMAYLAKKRLEWLRRDH